MRVFWTVWEAFCPCPCHVYKRADRKAFRRECAEIRWRAAWKQH